MPNIHFKYVYHTDNVHFKLMCLLNDLNETVKIIIFTTDINVPLSAIKGQI